MISGFILMLCAAGCEKYDKLPPRTSDNDSYLLPQGEVPTVEEKNVVQQMIDEYNNYMNN